MSFAKLTSMSHVVGYSSKFYYDGFSCIQCIPRTLQKGPTPPTDHQAQPPLQLKKKHHWLQPKQTYCPTQLNLIHRPVAITTVPSDPWKLIDQELEFKINDMYNCRKLETALNSSKQEQARLPVHRITEREAAVISRRNTKF